MYFNAKFKHSFRVIYTVHLSLFYSRLLRQIACSEGWKKNLINIFILRNAEYTADNNVDIFLASRALLISE